jgi:phosphoribosylamine-glycine ligase
MVVVLASAGYPGTYPKGEKIDVPESTPSSSLLIHAGTSQKMGRSLVQEEGFWVQWVPGELFPMRKIPLTCLCESVDFPSKFYRKDIGHREFSRGN